jgi:hypothetical protein
VSTIRPETGRGPQRERDASDVYLQDMDSARQQIRDLGFSYEAIEELAGLQPGYLSKMLHATTPSGRQASPWVQDLLFQVIYYGGVRSRRIPVLPIEEIRAALTRKLEARGFMPDGLGINERLRRKGGAGRVAIRDFSVEAGRKGGLERVRRLREAGRLSEFNSAAARARWARVKSKRPETMGNAPG